MTRLAIVCTHPIQYLSPVFQALSGRADVTVRVFYGCRGATVETIDPGFGQKISWDIPLLEGYDYEFVANVAKDPGSHHFRGIDLPSLCSRISDWKADALLIFGWCYKAHLGAMRQFRGKLPLFFRGDSTLLNHSSGWRAFLRLQILRWVYRSVDVAFYVGTENRRYFEASGLRPSQLVFAPHAVDNSRFADHSALQDARLLRQSLKIADDEVAILLPAKLEPIKSPELLLRSFASLGRINAHLLFAGSGPAEELLRAMQVARTHFLGFQNQTKMPGVYHAADLVALTSRSETWGLVLNEAMASGRAVLATDRVGAAVDLIHPGRNGWIVPWNDPNRLAAALSEACQLGRSGLAKMGEASSEIIRHWTIPIQVDAIAQTVRARTTTHSAA